MTYRFHVVVTSTQDVANGDTLWANLQLTYGLLAGASADLGRPEESVSVETTQTVLDSPACVTNIVTSTIDGGDDGTTWSYSGD